MFNLRNTPILILDSRFICRPMISTIVTVPFSIGIMKGFMFSIAPVFDVVKLSEVMVVSVCAIFPSLGTAGRTRSVSRNVAVVYS